MHASDDQSRLVRARGLHLSEKVETTFRFRMSHCQLCKNHLSLDNILSCYPTRTERLDRMREVAGIMKADTRLAEELLDAHKKRMSEYERELSILQQLVNSEQQ